MFLIAVCILGGALLDFACNGVFKVVWVLIYVPIYLGVAHALMLRLERTRWKPLSRRAVLSFFVGAALGHVLAVGRSRRVTYFMNVASSSPDLTLRSTQWPQFLVVQSAKLKQALPKLALSDKVAVTLRLVSDYGCTRSSTIQTIGGVDFHADRDASWTWRSNSWKYEATEEVASGPGSEDHAYPWCRIRFY